MPILKSPLYFRSSSLQSVPFPSKKMDSSTAQKKMVNVSLEFFVFLSDNKKVKNQPLLSQRFTSLSRLKSTSRSQQHFQSLGTLSSFRKLLSHTLGIKNKYISDVHAYTEIIQPTKKHAFFKHKMGHHHNLVEATHSQSNATKKPMKDCPKSSFLIHKPRYSLSYNGRNRTPDWVYEHLTAENIKGKAQRSHSEIKEDKRIPLHLRSRPIDYKKSGFDLGHMAPAGDHRTNQKAMDDTFYMTNMCPQHPKFNSGYWARLEKHVRDLTKEYRSVSVVTGPLYLPYNENGKRYVKYQVIGNNVAVPTHFFKVLMLEDHWGKKDKEAYILPNQEIPLDTLLDKFKTTIQKVEKAAGFVLPK